MSGLPEILSHYDIPFYRDTGNVRVNCPFDDHTDRTASFSANMDTGLWKCHGCDRQGNIITLIAQKEEVTNAEARQRANEILGECGVSLLDSDESSLSFLPKRKRNNGGSGTLLPPWVR